MALVAASALELAVNGGPCVRPDPWPARFHFGEEEKQAANEIFDTAIKTGNPPGYNGEIEQIYCKEVAEFLGGGHVAATNSGTTAVYVALRSLELEPFSEIIVSPITDPGGIMPIAMLNCVPVVADAAPGKYNTGPEQIEALISPLTKAIVVAHIGGEPVDIKSIMQIAEKHNIPVAEDCAQAHGATIDGKLVGTFGDVASFSTMFGKHYCTAGQGGFVFTKNENRYWAGRRAADRGKPFGLEKGSTNHIASLNFNLGDLNAAIGRAQLKKLPGIVAKRRAFVDKLKPELEKLSGIIIPSQIPSANPSYWWWRLGVDTERISCTKKEYCAALFAEGMPITPEYNHIQHTKEWFKNRRVFGSSGHPWTSPLYKGDADRTFPCPNAVDAIARHFNLTIYESWGEKELKDIVTGFQKVDAAFAKN